MCNKVYDKTCNTICNKTCNQICNNICIKTLNKTKNGLSVARDTYNSLISQMTSHFPLNSILYGPPGTGKNYNTVLRAAEIIENRKIDSYSEALAIFKANLHDQIEFITFHQNYSYEDFIQGLRPDTENDNQLTFDRKDGIFKVIADKALQNLEDSEKPPVAKRIFEEVFNEFINPLVEGEVEEIEVKMKKVSSVIEVCWYLIACIKNQTCPLSSIRSKINMTTISA